MAVTNYDENLVLTVAGGETSTPSISIAHARGAGIMLDANTPAGNYDIEVSLDGTVWAVQSTITVTLSTPFFIDMTNLTTRFMRVKSASAADMGGTGVTVMIARQY